MTVQPAAPDAAPLIPHQALSARDWHVWCPAPFRLEGPDGEQDWLAFSAWPKTLGFEGWRSGARLFTGPLQPEGGLAAVSEITPSGTGYVSAINTRVVVAADGPHLFFGGVWPDGRYDICHAPLRPDGQGGLAVGAAQTRLLAFEAGTEGQGPTNPAPVICADGTWGMVYRKAAAPCGARSLHMARAPAATGPWVPVPGAFPAGGDLEDPVLWDEGGVLGMLVRDIGGSVSGKSWPAIARARLGPDGVGGPDLAHVLNRALPGADRAAALWHRVERPAHAPGGRLWLACALADPVHTEMRSFDWPEAAPYLAKPEAPAIAAPPTLPMPTLPVASGPTTPEPTTPEPAAPEPAAPKADLIDTVLARHLSYLPRPRLESIRAEVARLTAAGAGGLIVECGVALGGSGIVMAAEMGPGLAYRGYDVFGQIPPPSATDGPGSAARYEVIDSGRSGGIGGETYYGYVPDLLDRVKTEFAVLGAPVDGTSIRLVQGLFQDTLHFAPDTVIRLAHIDCDWYEGTRLCLERIAPFMPKWGVMLIDDFADWPGCRRAVHEFLAANGDFVLREVQPHAVIRRFEVSG